MEFNYPIDYSLYNVDEITIIIKFLDMIEECYTQGVDLADYKECYKEFKSIVRSKSEENNLYRDFTSAIFGLSDWISSNKVDKFMDDYQEKEENF